MHSQNHKNNEADNSGLINEITIEQNKERKIALLDKCLEKEIFNGNEILEIIHQNSNDAVVRAVLINHPRLKASHLVRIFEVEGFAIACLQHKNFPADAKEYEIHSSQPFSKTVHYLMINICKMIDRQKQHGDVLLFIDLLLIKCPSLLPASTLQLLSKTIMGWYFNADDEISKTTLTKALEMIVKHTDYYIPPHALFMKSETSRLDYRFESSLTRYPFYFAAMLGLEPIFNYFYFHKDTPSLAIQHAVGLVNARESKAVQYVDFKEGKTFNYMLTSIHMLYLNPDFMILTLFLLKNLPIEENIDVACYLFNLVIRTKDPNPHLSGKENYYREKTGFQPLFWKKSISLEECILKILNVIHDEYLIITESVAGSRRARLFSSLLCNERFSTGCHAVIAYTLLTEGNYLESTLKILASKAIPDIAIIKFAAEKYAEEKGGDLDKMVEGLFLFVRKTDYALNYFDYINEDKLFEHITAKENDCLQM